MAERGPLGSTFAEDRLRDLKALTDVSLGHLDVEDLLIELLDRVLAILEADTAAILLLDDGTQELVARAARGIEEEVRQGVRIPVGRGFAGRIAAERLPVILDHVDETTVTNPLLWEAGIQAMLGVPLMIGGMVIGVLHVGTLGSRRFTGEDAELLQIVADRVAGATQARQLEVERAAARAIQRSLLPTGLPSVPGLEFATRYMPAGGAELGGDWYDVFVLPSGVAWVVAGDVGGHGFRASIVMGRLRSTIRAYALEEREPAEVLDLADRKLQHFEPSEIATVACATMSPPYRELCLATAGHPPAIIAMPGSEAAFVETEKSLPLGAPSSFDRSSTTVPLPSGGILFLYTDGLIERRYESLDVGLERLRAVVKADRAEIVCRTVLDTLIGDSVPDDDVAMVTIRTRPDR